MTAELAIVVPTYREHGNITRLYRALSASLGGQSWELVFVDDDSDDGSAEELAGLARADGRVRCLRRVGRRGLSSACIEGIRATTTPFVCVMDADLQHDESVIPSLLEFLKGEGGDLAVASRYVTAGSTGGLPPARAFISRAATFMCRAISGVPLSDPLSGFFMIRRRFFDEAEPKLSGRGFKLLLDIVLSRPGRIALREIPYSMRSREQGESKLSVGVVRDLLVMLAHHASGRFATARGKTPGRAGDRRE